jgi:DNA modification methylase
VLCEFDMPTPMQERGSRKMRIIDKKVEELKLYDKNARKHPQKQIDVLAENIKKFGFTTPVLISEDNEVIAGHGRLLALKQLGRTEVPCVKMEGLTKEEVKALRLADNQIASMGEWDMDLAIPELRELSDEMLDLTGFDRDLLIEPDEKDDIVPENAPTRAKTGDVWALGRHRVMCGDSTKKEDVERLMDGKKADMVFTDPPYNVNYSGRGEETSNTIENDNLTEKAFREFLESVFENYRNILKPEGGIYVCYASRTHREFEDALNKNNFEVKNQIIWVKLVASMGWGDYRWKHEPIFYCHQKGTSIEFYGDRKQYTQWDEERDDKWLLKMIKAEIKKQEDGGSTVWRFGREFNYKHPTQKPVQMVMKALFNSSKSGNLISDLFLGSGSTLIAAEKTGRICYGMEIDPKYVDVIIQRYEDYGGNKATKL